MKLEIPSTIAEIMTRDVVTVEEADSLANLLDSLKTLHFRHLPVTDEDRLIGLVTETDLLGIASSNLLPHHAAQDQALQQRLRVGDVMVRDVLTVTPDTSVQQAARMLLKQRVNCLPVVDERNVLVGIVTSSDFTKLIALGRRERSSSGSGEPQQLP
jgi:CBS-domain-containing membrane protein